MIKEQHIDIYHQTYQYQEGAVLGFSVICHQELVYKCSSECKSHNIRDNRTPDHHSTSYVFKPQRQQYAVSVISSATSQPTHHSPLKLWDLSSSAQWCHQTFLKAMCILSIAQHNTVFLFFLKKIIESICPYSIPLANKFLILKENKHSHGYFDSNWWILQATIQKTYLSKS